MIETTNVCVLRRSQRVIAEVYDGTGWDHAPQTKQQNRSKIVAV